MINTPCGFLCLWVPRVSWATGAIWFTGPHIADQQPRGCVRRPARFPNIIFVHKRQYDRFFQIQQNRFLKCIDLLVCSHEYNRIYWLFTCPPGYKRSNSMQGSSSTECWGTLFIKHLLEWVPTGLAKTISRGRWLHRGAALASLIIWEPLEEYAE